MTKRRKKKNDVIGYVKVDIGDSKGITTPILRRGGIVPMRGVTFNEFIAKDTQLRVTISIGKKNPYAHLKRFRPSID